MGELILSIPPENKAIVDAGSIIIYPTKYLHEVKKLAKERIVCVGWIESYIRRMTKKYLLA